MANDGQIVFEVTADGKHAIADIRDITKAIQQETGKWDGAAKTATDGIMGSFSGLLKKLVAGFSAVKVGKALLDLGQDALQAASDLQEVQNVVDVTFGSNANQIEEWAKNAGDQFGLTETQAKKFTSTMGAMLKSSGLAGEQIVDVSTDLAGLAADMASFYNLDFEEAFSKIRSGISGMTMPLKELGIDMSVDTLNAFALAQGLEKTFDKMSQSEQTMLRYQYLMQATADAQGDFARTSDGYANAMRKLQTNVDSLKTALGTPFLDAVAGAVGALNGFLEQLKPQEGQKTVLDDFLEIDQRTEQKLAEIAQIKEEAEITAGVLDDLFGTGKEDDTQGKDAAEVISKYGAKSGEAAAYLQNLGFTTEEITTKQNAWLETCKRLVKTIPGLNAIINTETGEVKGGTQAVKDYIDAWESGQKRLIMLGAIEQKEAALSSRFSDLPGLELDKAVAERRVRQSYDQLQKLYEKYGLELGFNQDGSVYRDFGRVYGLTSEDKALLDKETDYFEQLQAEAEAADAAYQKQVDALEEAKAALEEAKDAVGEYGNETETTLSEVEQYYLDHADTIREAVKNAADAIRELDQYTAGVRESVEKAVESTVKGFERIETPAMKAASKIADVGKKLEDAKNAAKKDQKEIDKLQKEYDTLLQTGGDKITGHGIAENLRQQAQYMTDYLNNLEAARSKGISNDVLAELSDGSEESYDILAGLATASDDEVKQINAAYQDVIDKRKEMTDTLTGQQLTVDKTYQSLAEKAKQAVDALNMEELAAENSGKTIQGMATGIAKHIPDVQESVDGIIEQLDRLNGYGINIDFGGFGNITFTTSTGKTEGSGLMGIPLVPHDGYIARLHEGERVLTAQENQTWNALLNGGFNGFDLDSLGGVMRDNIKPGGNVYLDGKVVGNVISDFQGRSYKSMQRSGWQS